MFKHQFMFDHIRDYILKFTREKIDFVTKGDHSSWEIGISKKTQAVEDESKGHYSWPCLSHETAMLLVEEYCGKGMKKGKCEAGGTSVYIEKACE